MIFIRETGNWSWATDVPPSFEHVLGYLRLVGVIFLACFLRLPTRKCFRGSPARQDEPRHAEQDVGVRFCSQRLTTLVLFPRSSGSCGGNAADKNARSRMCVSGVVWRALVLVQGKYDESTPLFERALVLTERSLGSHHPDTVSCRSWLARSYTKQGLLWKASQQLRAVVASRERLLGRHHHTVAEALDTLSVSLCRQVCATHFSVGVFSCSLAQKVLFHELGGGAL